MNSKQWIKVTLSTTLLGFFLLILSNYVVDPFGIFHTHILKHDFQVNERFVKIEFLEKNHKRFNGYMIGTSRIGTTNPKLLEKYIPNAKIYNLTMNRATLYDYLMHIRYMIKAHYPIKTLYMQLDGINMNYYGSLSASYLTKLHPYVTNDSLTLFYFDYLSSFFPFNIKNKIAQNIDYTFKTIYDLETGVWKNPSIEQRIVEDCEAYVQQQDSFHRHNRAILKYSKQKETIRDLKEIVALCQANNIKLYTFIVPHHKVLLDSFIIDDYLAYLKDIATITDFYDFSGYNSITTNNCNYYERSHYRPLVGELIAARIFHDNTLKVPKDFGQRVTKENINEHLRKLKKNMQEYRKKEPVDPLLY